MSNCPDDETVEHLLIKCQRTKEILQNITEIGMKFDVCMKSVIYGVFKENWSPEKKQ